MSNVPNAPNRGADPKEPSAKRRSSQRPRRALTKDEIAAYCDRDMLRNPRIAAPAPSPTVADPAPSPAADPAKDTFRMNGKEGSLRGRLSKMGGSRSDDFNAIVGQQAVESHWYGNSDQANTDTKGMATIGGMLGIAPQDEIEGMLAAQMIATHNASMECFRRAMHSEQSSDARESNLSQANRLSRSFINMMQAIDKRRGKGQQKVIVEHVHVHQGGQAIVGHVTHEQRIAAEETVRQVTHATGSTLPTTVEGPVLEGVPGGGGTSHDGD